MHCARTEQVETRFSGLARTAFHSGWTNVTLQHPWQCICNACQKPDFDRALSDEIMRFSRAHFVRRLRHSRLTSTITTHGATADNKDTQTTASAICNIVFQVWRRHFNLQELLVFQLVKHALQHSSKHCDTNTNVWLRIESSHIRQRATRRWEGKVRVQAGSFYVHLVRLCPGFYLELHFPLHYRPSSIPLARA